MQYTFLKKAVKPARKKNKKYHESGTLALMMLGLVLVLSLLPVCQVKAETPGSSAIKLVMLDDWDETALAGASVTLQQKTGDTYAGVAGKGGLTVLPDGLEFTLEPGDYKLIVNNAPASHLTSSQPVEFRVTDGKTVLVNGVNAEIKDAGNGTYKFIIYCTLDYSAALPSTGGGGTLPYTLGGLLMMAAAAAGWVCRQRKRRGTE